MTLHRNAAFGRVVDELRRMGPKAQQSPTQADDYQSFLQRFPAPLLPDLSLDAYCVGKGDGASFCWWLERGLEPLLGRYMPGTARGHLLYFSKNGSVYKHRKLNELPDAEALRYTLKVHAAIANADPMQDLRWVDDDAQIYQRAEVAPRVTMGEGRKLRLLAAYWPEAVLPISSSDHLAHFLRALGCSAVDIPRVHQPVARMLKLMTYFETARELCPGITPQGFMKALYAPTLGLAPPRHVEEVLGHFAAVPNLAEHLKAAGQTDAFCSLVLALHESDLDWWVTRDGAMHAGRTDDPKVWQTVVALQLECSQQGIQVRLNAAGVDERRNDADDQNSWQPLDVDYAARMADAASSDIRVPPLTNREACWPDDYDGSDTTLSVLLTQGAIRNGYLKVPKLQALFPTECIAPDEKVNPQRTFTLQLPEGEPIQTWVLANRNRLRVRFNSLFAKAQLLDGDRAVIHKEADGLYSLGFQRQGATSAMANAVPDALAPTVPAPSRKAIMNAPLNQILFGPPGTGKTYATIDAALKILDRPFWELHHSDRKALKRRFDALSQAERVRFVTFHQSFSYEDFVEGLRATTDEETKQLRYEVVDGVFKALCYAAQALAAPQPPTDAPYISIQGRKVWKMSLGDTQGPDAEVYDECIDGGYILLGYGAQVDFSGTATRDSIAERYQQAGVVPHSDYAVTSVQTFVTQMQKGDLVVVTDGNLKFRAIGEITGDYQYHPHATWPDGYSQKRSVRWLRKYTPSLPHTELMKRKQFSQRTLYQLQLSALDAEKLQRLLDGPGTPVAGELSLGPVGISDYVVTQVTEELVVLTKPNGNQLPFARAMLDVLAQAVRDELITIDDIKNKQAVTKLPGKGLEPYLVNGYPNILAPLVMQLTASSADGGVRARPDEARVLIIDEINRGNIARIFGEIITLIEPSKRAGADEALEVVLPYSKDRFSVPKNVYLIGTMNTADRSLTGLDVALRRRFVFQEMPPCPYLLDGVTVPGVDGVTVGQIMRTLNQRIEALLDRDHCLGHAYFMPLREGATLELLGSIFRNQVLPLLQEYFFDDWQRIQWVLNDHRKAKAHQFVQTAGVDVAALFGPEANVTLSSQGWLINEAAFEQAQSYWGIVNTAPIGNAASAQVSVGYSEDASPA